MEEDNAYKKSADLYVNMDDVLIISRRALLFNRGHVTAERDKVRPEDSVWSWAIPNALKSEYRRVPKTLIADMQSLGVLMYDLSALGIDVAFDDFDDGPEVA